MSNLLKALSNSWTQLFGKSMDLLDMSYLAEKRLCGLVRKEIHFGHIKQTKNDKMIQNNNKGMNLKKVKQHSKDQIKISPSVFHDNDSSLQTVKNGLFH